jgi:glutamine synthetase
LQGPTKEDLLKLIKESNIKILNLCHIPEDSHLKTLSFAANNRERLEEVLELGERVDGSSLFSFIDPDRSDIYVAPRLETAFIDPFSLLPAMNILCRYLDENGKPLQIAPETILEKAAKTLQSSTGIDLKVLAELEFYLIDKPEETAFQDIRGSNYHESTPFTKLGDVRNEIMARLENLGVPTKYGHAEAGKFRSKNGYSMEQHEIEFQPQSLMKMAETVPLAKWVARNVCARHGVSISFSPKLALDQAGNGMHLHVCGERGKHNIIADTQGNLSNEARQMIGGILSFARGLAAFANTIPPSYFRFLSRKESPMHVCWGAKNRLALIRIPLWWSYRRLKGINECKRTFEYRGPDPSANSHLLLAALAVAVQYGLANPKKAAETAANLNADSATMKRRQFETLPLSCSEAAESLRKVRGVFEAGDVFPRRVIDGVIGKLESYEDSGLWKKLTAQPGKIDELLWTYVASC